MSGSLQGGVDSSIPLQAGRNLTQPVNPLQVYGEYANLRAANNQNALFPGQQALQQQAIQQGGIGIQANQLSLQQKRMQAASAALIPALNGSSGPITHSSLTTTLGGIEAALPGSTGGIIARIAKEAPGGDGTAFSQWAKQTFGTAALTDPGQQLQVNAGTPGQVSNGQDIQPGVTGGVLAPGGAAFSPAGQNIPVYPSREALLSPAPGVDANGHPTNVPAVTRAGQQGVGALTGPAGGASPLAGAFRAPVVPAAAGGAPAAVPSNGIPTGLSPDEIASRGISAKAAGDAYQRAGAFQTDMFPLQAAQEALKNAPTGRGSEVLQNFKSVINTIAPNSIRQFVGPDEVAAYDEANKYLTQVQQQQAGAGRSDLGLQTAGAASPSVHISNDAAQIVLRGMVGLRRMEQAGTQAFIASGQPEGNYNRFLAQWANQADPKVYTFDMLNPAQRSALVNSMTPAKRAQFGQQLEAATQSGMMEPPASNGR